MRPLSGSHPSQIDASGTVSRFVIVDPAIVSASGHHLGTACALSAAARHFGHKPIWLGHKRLDATPVPDHVTFVPAFSSNIYENQIGLIGRLVRPLIGNRMFLRKTLRERAWERKLQNHFSIGLLMGDRQRELIQTLSSLNLTALDSLVLPTADGQTVDMLASWCQTHRWDDLPHIHIRTCWTESNMPSAEYRGGFSNAIKRVAAVSRKLALSAETEGGARFWSGKTGFNFDVSHCIVDLSQLPDAQALPIKTPVTVAWLGEPRVEKGAEILPKIITRVLAEAKPDHVKFLLQGSGRSSRRARELDARLVEFGEAVVRLPVGLTSSDYAAALSQSNILLLPYDPECYPANRGSGIACEGLLTAKPMVATRGTFADSLITCGNGVIGSNVEELASGILQIISNFDKFQLGALRAREKAIANYDLLSTYLRISAPQTRFEARQ